MSYHEGLYESTSLTLQLRDTASLNIPYEKQNYGIGILELSITVYFVLITILKY